ncbi:exported hypothetical protein [Gammaproteobacteria bacterium]
MKKLFLLPLLALALLVPGCASFSTNTFRAEQTAVNLAHGAYVGWTNYLAEFPVSAERSNAVKVARLKFAATAGTVEALRASYETNNQVRPTLEATLLTLADQSSNIVWLVTFFKEGAPAKSYVLVTNVYRMERK